MRPGQEARAAGADTRLVLAGSEVWLASGSVAVFGADEVRLERGDAVVRGDLALLWEDLAVRGAARTAWMPACPRSCARTTARRG